VRGLGHYENAVVSVARGTSVREVADRMDEHAVGCVVVVDDSRAPVGILTDRDLVRRVVAAGRDPDKTSAGDVMSGDLATGSTEDPLERLLERMQQRGVRRLPVVLHSGALAGIVTLDDVVCELGRELGDLRAALRKEVLGARRSAPRRRRLEEIEGAFEEIREKLVRLGIASRERLQREFDALRQRISGRDS
jgi:CBS domain-containing protein